MYVDPFLPDNPYDSHIVKGCHWGRSLEECEVKDGWQGMADGGPQDGCYPAWNYTITKVLY